jgi:hypothetical protein
MDAALPKRLAAYVHDTGTRALDHLAENVAPAEEGVQPDALQSLVGHWRSMAPEQKEDFVDQIAAAVGEVIAMSTLLPVGIKAGKRVIKSARKALKRSAKTLKKTAKAGAGGKEKGKKQKKQKNQKKEKNQQEGKS